MDFMVASFPVSTQLFNVTCNIEKLGIGLGTGWSYFVHQSVESASVVSDLVHKSTSIALNFQVVCILLCTYVSGFHLGGGGGRGAFAPPGS